MQKPTLKAKTTNHPDNIRRTEERKARQAELVRQNALKPKTKETLLFEAQMIELDHRYEWTTKQGFLVTSMKFRHTCNVMKPVTRLYGASLPVEGIQSPTDIESSASGCSIAGSGFNSGTSRYHKLGFWGIIQDIANPMAKSIEDFDYSRLSQISKDSDLWKNTIGPAIEELGLEATLAKVLLEVFEAEEKRPKGFVCGNSVGWGHRSYD